jgi:hypothetical protein
MGFEHADSMSDPSQANARPGETADSLALLFCFNTCLSGILSRTSSKIYNVLVMSPERMLPGTSTEP